MLARKYTQRSRSILGGGEAQQPVELDEACRRVPHVPFILGGAPVERVLVVPVMEALAHHQHRNKVVVGRLDVLVPGTTAEHVAD